ncbi:MAG: hypothetical protein HC850_12855 [Rhodomicrobium sp.]|nr:hypothetical protein [Rhodomicrobium sp.]
MMESVIAMEMIHLSAEKRNRRKATVFDDRKEISASGGCSKEAFASVGRGPGFGATGAKYDDQSRSKIGGAKFRTAASFPPPEG